VKQAWLALALIAWLWPFSANSQPAVRASAVPPPSEQQRQNLEAQTEYYRVQAEKLRHPDLWTYLSGTLPVSVALIGVIISLVSFLRSQKRNIEQERNTQFYEALKRFGDKDSPMLRASAVGLLYTMATRPVENGEAHPFFDLVFEHFTTAINLEANREVLQLLRARLTDLASLRPSLQVMRESNLQNQRDLIRTLAEFFALEGAGAPAEITGDNWSAAPYATGYPRRSLKTLTERFSSTNSSPELTEGKTFVEILRTARDRASLLATEALANAKCV
jgi:hypothetical protein